MLPNQERWKSVYKKKKKERGGRDPQLINFNLILDLNLHCKEIGPWTPKIVSNVPKLS